MSQATAFPTLQGHSYMNLTTFRKSGVAVTTPVWFAQIGDRLYVVSMLKAGKTKRIRNNASVQVAPSTAGGKPLGPAVEATARIMAAGEDSVGHQALVKKYGLMYRAFQGLWALQRTPAVFLEIVPA